MYQQRSLMFKSNAALKYSDMFCFYKQVRIQLTCQFSFPGVRHWQVMKCDKWAKFPGDESGEIKDASFI